jgi:hypothetical protein
MQELREIKAAWKARGRPFHTESLTTDKFTLRYNGMVWTLFLSSSGTPTDDWTLLGTSDTCTAYFKEDRLLAVVN